MFTFHTSGLTTKRLGRGFTAATCALALVLALGGTTAASESARDLPDGSSSSVTAKGGVDSSGWLTAKLRTTTGYRVLVLE